MNCEPGNAHAFAPRPHRHLGVQGLRDTQRQFTAIGGRGQILTKRDLTPDEARETTAMARRLAALRLPEPAMDAGYQAVKGKIGFPAPIFGGVGEGHGEEQGKGVREKMEPEVPPLNTPLCPHPELGFIGGGDPLPQRPAF